MFAARKAALLLKKSSGVFGVVSNSMRGYQYQSIKVAWPSEFVANVQFDRPDKRNAINKQMWADMWACFDALSLDENCRAIVLSGNGKMFCAGIDVTDLTSVMSDVPDEADAPRRAKVIRQFLELVQKSITSIEKCAKPVIAACHGGVIGAGVDIITACDIRFAANDSVFCIKEIDMGLAADVGTLQRLPKQTGSDSLCRELVYTARNFSTAEAEKIGLISRTVSNADAVLLEATQVAKCIAEKTPVAVQVAKASLNYSRDHSVDESLRHIADLNQMALQSEDVVKAAMSALSKTEAHFAKL